MRGTDGRADPVETRVINESFVRVSHGLLFNGATILLVLVLTDLRLPT